MSVVAFFSAKGAPGTTTAAMLAASLWPRPALLADCDPAGGDMGLRLPAADGRPLDLGKGMLSLLPVARRSLDPTTLVGHAQEVLGGGQLLVGLSGPEQAAAAGPVWAAIAGAFGSVSTHDVVMDLGRLDSKSPVMPLATAANLATCVIDSSVSGVYSGRARLRSLIPTLQGVDGGGPVLGLIVRSEDRREADDAAAVIRSEFPHVVYLGHLRTDPAGARIFDGRLVSRPERTLLVRAGVAVVTAMETELSRLLLSRIQRTEPPRTRIVGAADLLLDDPDSPPRRSRLEERRFGQVGQARRVPRLRRGGRS